MAYLSCSPDTIYRDGGFFETPAELADLRASAAALPYDAWLISELYPPYRYQRPDPDLIQTGSDAFRLALAQHYEMYNLVFSAGAAAAAVGLRNALVHGNVLYVAAPSGFRVIYETQRPHDRPYVPLLDEAAATEVEQDLSDQSAVSVFIGSAGSGNYGHWLVDDLPRAGVAATLSRLSDTKSIRLWITSYGEQMDRVRIESLQHVCRGLPRVEIGLLHYNRTYRFDILHYVTPTSYHPVLKSPQSLQFVANSVNIAPADAAFGERVFIMRRPSRGRSLVNQDEIAQLLSRSGFVLADVEGMSFVEQASLCARASVVIGCMGAAMTNTVFCRRGTRILYLGPEGWIEPFYWDAAASRGHSYAACYGAVEDSSVPAHLSAYRIDLDELKVALDRLELASAALP